MVTLDSTGLCYSQVETYRLHKLTVTVTGSDEKVGVTLAPVGTLAKLQDFGEGAEAIL